MEAETKVGQTALHSAAWQGYIQIVQYLVSKGAMIDALTRDGNSPLMLAALTGKFPVVQFLVVKNARLDFVNKLNETVLNIAEKNGQTLIVEYLRNELEIRGFSSQLNITTIQEEVHQNVSSERNMANADQQSTFSTKIHDGSIPLPTMGPSCSIDQPSLNEEQVEKN